MEELTRLQASCKAFKGHVTRLQSKIDELMAAEFDDYMITSMTTAIEQLKKSDKIAQIDEKITTQIDHDTELESAMYDTEEFQDEILDKIARAQRFMELITAKPPQRSPMPTWNTSQSDPSQPQLENTPEQSNIVESGPVSVSAVESELGSVSITDAARLVSSITSTDNTPLAVTSSTISSHVALLTQPWHTE